MDSLGFRLPQRPPQPPASVVKKEVRGINDTKTIPAPDSRFEDYAAPMSDGRLVTDYRPACATRAPPGTQFAVKQWTVHNAEEIANVSRLRQAELTGQIYGTANTEMPPALYQTCNPYGCEFIENNGIGIERTDKAPALFGTFSFPPKPSRESTALNQEILGGRNTPARFTHLYA